MPTRKKRRTTKAKGEASRGGRRDATESKKGNGRASASHKGRGKCGRLADMPKMPLDILVEIFSLLHPRDLVNLARTSRDFRTFLMSRESAPFWRAARKQIGGLPDCPPFLSEPAYANLVFFTHCHGCARSNGSNVVVWSFAVRYCAKCKSEQFVKSSSVRETVTQIQERMKTGHDVLLATSLESFVHYYHRPEFNRIREAWEGGFSSDAERDQFYESANEDVRSRREFSSAISRWVEEQDARKAAELSLLRDGRIQEVERRLRDEGYGKDLDWQRGTALHLIKAMKSVCKTQKLTDRAWKTVRMDVMQVVEKYRGYRLCEERVEELRPRLTLLSKVVLQWENAQQPWSADTDWYPTFADLALMPTFRDCIDVSAETGFEDDAFSQMQSHMSDLVTRWREERKADILKMIRDALGSVPDDVDPLSLAVATFDCAVCSYKGMRWPQVLAHRCARGWSVLNPVTDKELYYRKAVVTACYWSKDRMWDIEAIVFNSSLERTRAAIKACGEDPDTATYEDMERCGVRLFCSDCQRRREALDWRMAARHGKDCSAPFKALNAEDAAKARALEAYQQSEAEDARVGDAGIIYGCRRCRYSGPLSMISEHCRSQHRIKKIRRDVDYYLHTNNPPHMPTPIRIYSQGHRQAALATNAAVHAKAAFVSSYL